MARYTFPKGSLNPSKRADIRLKISVSKIGGRNPNWKNKVSKACLTCGKAFTTLPSSLRKYCSKECGYKATSKKMRLNNPMKNPEVSRRVHDTQRKKGCYDNGGSLGKLWRESRSKMLESVRKQMTDHNPMHNHHSLRKAVAHRDYREIARKNCISVTKFCREHPELTPNRLMAKKQMVGKGYISSQQWLMFHITKTVFPDAEINHPIKTAKSLRFADVGIPSLSICLEYDAGYWHDQEKDGIRDRELAEVGWKTIRMESLENLGEILNEIREN